MSTTTSAENVAAVAPALADLLPVPKQRTKVAAFIRQHPTTVVGGSVLLSMLFIAIFAPWLGTVDPTALSPAKRVRQPSAEFWFGTDMLGRDVYSRVMYGARISLLVGFSVAAIASTVGTAIGLLIVNATFLCATAMIVEASLSFIGAGTPPTIPTWGNIMAEGRALWQIKPYIVFFPAVFLSITVLAVNMLGDGLRDALDPRIAKRLG